MADLDKRDLGVLAQTVLKMSVYCCTAGRYLNTSDGVIVAWRGTRLNKQAEQRV